MLIGLLAVTLASMFVAIVTSSTITGLLHDHRRELALHEGSMYSTIA